MSHLSDVFKYISYFRHVGHQVGRKVGDMLEVLTYSALARENDLLSRLCVEPKLHGFSDAGHKVEFVLFKDQNLDANNKPQIIKGGDIKNPNKIIAFIECKRVGVEQTINTGFKKKFIKHGSSKNYLIPFDKEMKVSSAPKRYFADGQWSSMLIDLEKSGALTIEGTSLRLTEVGKGAVERSLVLDVDPPKHLPFEIKIGPIASGNVVVKDGVTWGMLKSGGVRTVLGLEMEAATIGEVAKQCDIREWIVIKGVMDHADPNKADRFKSFAARASAEALRNFLIGRFST